MNDSSSIRATGGCLCGAVRYQVTGPLRSVINCHCSQCRRTSGHFVAATAAQRDNLILTVKNGLSWYQSSASAQRGFCKICGSSLFWQGLDKPYIAIMAGTLDQPTQLQSIAHIFVDDAGDYYSLEDGLPQFGGSAHGSISLEQ